MTLAKTASKTALLLQCSRPFSRDIETSDNAPGDAALYGSALHAVLAGATLEAALARFPTRVVLAELAAQRDRVDEALNTWIRDADAFGAWVVESREKSFSWNSRTAEYFETSFEEATHTYPNATPEDICGTADIILDAESGARVVFDYKTGHGNFSRPSRLPQLQVLAVMCGASHVGVIHCPRGAPVTIHFESFDETARAKFLTDLRAAIARIDDGSLRPGPECKYCPARSSCPAFMSDIVAESNSLLRLASGAAPLSDPADRGALHLFLTRFAQLEKRARELIRADVEAGEVIQRPDGKILQLVSKKFSNLSQSSIRRALPGDAGEKVIAELRASGCIEEGERLELHAK